MPTDLSQLTSTPSMSELTDPSVTPSLSNIGAEPPESGDSDAEASEATGAADVVAGEEEAEEALKDYESTPRSEWVEELKLIHLDETKSSHILDKVMSTGKYDESYRMGGTLFKLRTRTTVDADRTVEILQAQKPETSGVYAHIVSRVNLAASLVSYGETVFSHTDPKPDNRDALDKEWRQRYAFCAGLPAPAFYTLSSVLQRFDQKVQLSCDARSLVNF